MPRADFSETNVSFYTPVGSSIVFTEAKARQVDAILRELPEVRYTVATINTGQAQGRNQATVYVRLVDRKDRASSVDEMSGPLRERLQRIAGITVTHVGLLDPVGGAKPIQFSLQGPDLSELQRLTRALSARLRDVAGLVDLDTSLKPDKPTLSVQVRQAVEWVLSKQDDQGCWKLEYGYKGKMWIDIEKKGKPSKWITLRALRVIKRVYGS